MLLVLVKDGWFNIVFIVGFLIVLTSVHLLNYFEHKKIEPIGKIIEINNLKLHVYALGEKNVNKPTFVILSALAIPSPTYFYMEFMKEISKYYRVVLVERAGMGYSKGQSNKDISSILEHTREALKACEENGPYVLLPHSIGGLEALYWASLYPNEIKMIVGLDMLLPIYELGNDTSDKVNKLFSKLNIHLINIFCLTRFSFLLENFLPTKLYRKGLSESQIKQDKYLVHTHFLNYETIKELKYKKQNAKTVDECGFPTCPITLFVSLPNNTYYIGDSWLDKARKLEDIYNNVSVITLNCDHHVHIHNQALIVDYLKGINTYV